ncbi:MAG: glutamate 5-kinase, partial [Prevotellaceae bacterium]|nr:glutamate 5-kinase [Prevotellaceae bacterium]
MRIVIKIGSNVLTRTDGRLDLTRMSHLVDQIAELRGRGVEVIMVSSGAVAAGRALLSTDRQLDSVQQRQLFSALGQAKLINHYYDLFREYGLHVGQVLTMKENFATRREYLNQRACMQVMLQNGVIPIVNENDTVSVTELMFTDNDELSGLIAAMLDADELIILSNIDGIYNGSPKDPDASVIPVVEPDRDLSDYIQTEKSGCGRGGMITKCNIARKVADEGIKVIIANGKRDNILLRLFDAPSDTLHTEFTPRPDAVSTVKKWIAHSESFAKGIVRLNSPAVKALCSGKAVSLLFVGVTDIEGDFEEGDIVNIVTPENDRIAVGRSAYCSEEAKALIGKHDLKPLVHY